MVKGLTRTLVEHDAVMFGFYHEDSNRAAMSVRLEIPEDANYLNDGKNSLPLYAGTNDFEIYELIKNKEKREFRLPLPGEAIGVPYHTASLPITIPQTIITRDGRIFLEQSGYDKMLTGKDEFYKRIMKFDLKDGLRFAKSEFQHKNVWIIDSWMLQRIKAENFPVKVVPYYSD